MAKKAGPLKLRGSVQGLIFYKSGDQYYVKRKSSLDAKRVKSDPAFAKTRQEAGVLAQASPLASNVYRQLDKARRVAHYRMLTGRAQVLLRAGANAAAVMDALFEWAEREWGLKKKN